MLTWLEQRIDPYALSHEGITQAPGQTWASLLWNLRPYRALVALTVVFSLLSTAIEIGLIWYIGQLIDQMAKGAPGPFLVQHGAMAAIILGGGLIIGPLSQFVNMALLQLGIIPGFATQVRWRGHLNASLQPLSWFQSRSAGRIAHHVISASGNATALVQQLFSVVTSAVATVAGSIILLASIEPIFLPLQGLWLIGLLSMSAWILPRSRKLAHNRAAARSALAGDLNDRYDNALLVTLCTTHAGRAALDRKGFEHLQRAVTAERRMRLIIETVLVTLNMALVVGMTAFSVWLWSRSMISTGAAAAVFALALRLSSIASWILWSGVQIVESLGAYGETLTSIAPKPVRDGGTETGLLGGPLSLKGLKLSTRAQDTIDLTLPPGEILAVVGPSGAGKSSLLYYLVGLRTPVAGTIRIAGRDLSEMSTEARRQQFSMLDQDCALLNISVRDNLNLGLAKPLCDAVLWQALESSGVAEAVRRLKDHAGRRGLEAFVGSRVTSLSGGERQRIALTRAMLNPAPFLLLDEPTSALDAELSDQIMRVVETAASNGKGVVMVLHDLKLAQRADRILRLRDDRPEQMAIAGQ